MNICLGTISLPCWYFWLISFEIYSIKLKSPEVTRHISLLTRKVIIFWKLGKCLRRNLVNLVRKLRIVINSSISCDVVKIKIDYIFAKSHRISNFDNKKYRYEIILGDIDVADIFWMLTPSDNWWPKWPKSAPMSYNYHKHVLSQPLILM